MKKELDIFKNQLNSELKRAIKNKDNPWIKAPFDTGEMFRKTKLVSVNVNVKTMEIDVTVVSKEYLEYVAKGLGSNRKYGERDIIKWAKEHPRMKEPTENLVVAMIEERNKGTFNNIRNINIKV